MENNGFIVLKIKVIPILLILCEKRFILC